MKNIIFIAPPAAGKGTMSKMLVERYGYVHISTGDLLRDSIKNNNELGQEIAKILESGKLVSDEIVLKLLDNRIREYDCQKGFILDGYPRNVNQVDSLMQLFKNLKIDNYLVIYLDIDYLEAMNRTLGRLVCAKCHTSYNKYNEKTKPKVENICDKCGSLLESRTDDTEETFKIRYQSYIDETRPVIDYFKNNGLLNVVKSVDDPEEILKQIVALLEA